MEQEHRPWTPATAYFITMPTFRGAQLFKGEQAMELWLSSLRQAREENPFELEGQVILPDHLHLLIRVPHSTADVAARIDRARALFANAAAASTAESGDQQISPTQVWKRNYLEHMVADQTEFDTLLDYIHYNPVEHGLAESPRDWPYSTFMPCVEKGRYLQEWGTPMYGMAPDFSAIKDFVGE
jgi:putative transposase